MKQLKVVKAGVIFTISVVLLAAITPFITLAQSANGITAVNNIASIQPTISFEQLQTMAQQQKTIDNQKITDSVNENYLKLKASGKIPEVNGPCTIILNDDPNNFSTNASGKSISPMTMHYYTNYQFGHSWIGISTAQYVQDFDTNTNGLHNDSNTLGGPAGGVDAWGWTGTTFTWTGTSGIYNFVFYGYKNGYTTAYSAYASASTEVDYVVYDNSVPGGQPTHGVDYTASVAGIGYTQPSDTNIGDSMTAQLTNGHSYSVYLKIDSQSTVYGVGESASNFHDSNGGLWFYNVNIY